MDGRFQTSLTQVYLKASRIFGLTAQDLQRVALQAVRCSFLSHEAKMAHMQRIQDRMEPGGIPQTGRRL